MDKDTMILNAIYGLKSDMKDGFTATNSNIEKIGIRVGKNEVAIGKLQVKTKEIRYDLEDVKVDVRKHSDIPNLHFHPRFTETAVGRIKRKKTEITVIVSSAVAIAVAVVKILQELNIA